MPKEIELSEVLARNPQIDPDRLGRTVETLRRLRSMGLRRKEYDLASPFGGRRASVPDDPRMEPRLRQLADAFGTE